MTSDAYRRSGKWAWMKFSWGQEAEVHHGGEQSGNGGPAVLGQDRKKEFFRRQVSRRRGIRQKKPARSTSLNRQTAWSFLSLPLPAHFLGFGDLGGGHLLFQRIS